MIYGSNMGLSCGYKTVTQVGLMNVCEGLISLDAHQHVMISRVDQYPQGSSLLHLGGLLSPLVSVTQVSQIGTALC